MLKLSPKKFNFVKATSFGQSLWTKTAKVETITSDEPTRFFFLKVATGAKGKTMFEGEYEGMLAMHRAAPKFAPKPIAWGQYKNDPDTWFFLEDFVDMEVDELPDPEDFCSKLADMHKSSTSPTGKFGFDVVTCCGTTPQRVDWEESWEKFFARALRNTFEQDLEINGPQPELVEAVAPIFDTVIPRLLRPLQQGPNPIRPHTFTEICGRCLPLSFRVVLKR